VASLELAFGGAPGLASDVARLRCRRLPVYKKFTEPG
jgi:hypothetical protein